MQAVAITALPLLVPLGYWLGLAITLVWGLLAWNKRRGQCCLKQAIGHGDGLLLALLLGVGMVELAAGAWHDSLRQALPLAGAAWLAALVLVMLRAVPPRPLAWWAGLAVSGLGVGGWAAWQKLVEGLTRATGHPPLHSIFFGNLALLSALLCLAGLGWAWQQRTTRFFWVALLLSGAAGGGLASALSGTRGGWLALPLVIGVFYGGYARRWPAAWRWLALSAVLALIMAMYVIPQSGVEKRVDKAVAEVHRYIEGTDYGSVGARLEMYRGALVLIRERPLVGYGHQGYQPAMQALEEKGVLSPGLGNYWHAHNDLLDAWVRRGLPGFLMVLALYLVPLWRFLPGLRTKNPVQRSFAVAGVLLPVAFMGFGLSYSFFAYPAGIAVYSGWLIFLWVQVPGKVPQDRHHVFSNQKPDGPLADADASDGGNLCYRVDDPPAGPLSSG
ncbi:O-antigen ligase family protein [Vreelandella rituensis]|uniref:O-antigen ligase domain-containing protein n=1 Tax=Vreelandella rituensis TaxID=2282306 RepID=A0A368TYJ0_9GAMM|nr:O-antigen ligase family protein [Halomonas rituensis]RCV89297.1 O-antigen ligase domain-containing protein [Halomonas rituensis]